MIGCLHAFRPGRAAPMYDLLEPLRPRADRMVLRDGFKPLVG